MFRKILLLLIVVLVLFFLGCSSPQTHTTLTITNESSHIFDNATWNDAEFGEIKIGESITKNVSPGEWKEITVIVPGIWSRTGYYLTIEKGEHWNAEITDDWLIPVFP